VSPDRSTTANEDPPGRPQFRADSFACGQCGGCRLTPRPLHGATGLYVDVGASSPYLGSVTRHFYEAGWRGIDVEPLAEEAAELRRARPRDVVIEAALGAAAGEVTLYVIGDERGLSSTDSDVGSGYVRAGRPCENESSRNARWPMSSTSTAPGRSRSSRSTSRVPSRGPCWQ